MLGHALILVTEANQRPASQGEFRGDHVLQRVREAHGLLDAATDVELVAEDAVVRVEHLHIEEALGPIHLAEAEPHAVERIHDVRRRELALVMESATVGMLVGDVPVLALGHEGGIGDRQLAILVQVVACHGFEVVAEDAIDIGLRIGQILVGIAVEVAHQGRAPAVPVAVHLGRTVGFSIAVDDLGTIVPHRHGEFTGGAVHVDADHAPVVLIVVLVAAEGVGIVVPIDPHHQVVHPVGNARHVDPLAGQARPVDVAAVGRNPHVAAAVGERAAIAALEVHHAEAVLEADGQHLAVHGEEVVLGVALVVPMVVAIAPLELLGGIRLGRRADVVIDVPDVLDVGREANELALTVAIETTLDDVAVVLVDHHRLGLEAVFDGALDDHQVRPGAQWVTRVDAAAIVHLSGGIVVAGRLVGASLGRASVFQGPIEAAAVPGQVGEAHPVGHSGLEQHVQLSALLIVLATALVVVVVDRPLVGVVEVVHVAVVVDPQPRVAARTTTRQGIHAIVRGRERPPLHIAGSLHGQRIVSQLQSDGLVARPPGRAVDGVALAVAVVAAPLNQLLSVKPDLVERVGIQAIAIAVVHREDHARLPIRAVDAEGEQGVIGIGHIGLEEQVPVSIGQLPAHFIGPGIGLDDDGEGVLALTILGQNAGGKQQGEREEYSAHDRCLGGRCCTHNGLNPTVVACTR